MCPRQRRFIAANDQRNGRVGGPTAVFDVTCDALYPSRKVRSQSGAREFVSDVEVPVFNRIGVYALRPVALRAYLSWPKGVSERLNGLEPLGFLENGARLLCARGDACGRQVWELNTPKDVSRIESVLKTHDAVIKG
jgi:3-deoxy-manno-octulosonate cytidylyltransferase (CMP-KDO synthetase)